MVCWPHVYGTVCGSASAFLITKPSHCRVHVEIPLPFPYYTVFIPFYMGFPAKMGNGNSRSRHRALVLHGAYIRVRVVI